MIKVDCYFLYSGRSSSEEKSGKLRTSDARTYTYTKTREARTASPSSGAIAHFVRDPLVSFHSGKQRQNHCSAPHPPVYQDLSTRHDWPVKKTIVDLPIRLQVEGKFKTHCNSLSPLEAENKDLGTASQTLPTGG